MYLSGQTEEKQKYGSVLRRLRAVVVTCACMILLSACANPFVAGGDNDTESAETEQEYIETGFVLAGPDGYDSADTPILVGKDEEKGTLTFLNLDVGRRYTLSYDGTTKFYDRYGTTLSLDQMNEGDIVDVTFLKGKKHLTTMQLSPSAWQYDNVERYEINETRKELSIGSDIYKLTKNTQYFSQGRIIERMDLNATDVLSVQGIDNHILSVSVEKGHGYLRLNNDEKFLGGWIEIGQTMIQQITENMLLVVPEGSYEVKISNKGGGGIKTVIINRNEETVLDIGDLEVPEPQTGMILFSLTPSNAEIYLDGEKVDTSQPVTLEYGIHQMIARATGYQSITQYIRVAQKSAGLDVVLDKTEGSEEEETREESTDDEENTTTATDYYKVYIDAPENVEVYVDGNYVGIAPCNFRKVSGSHVITLRRTGYETRSYTIQVDDDDKDVSFSFVELIANPTENSSVSSGDN